MLVLIMLINMAVAGINRYGFTLSAFSLRVLLVLQVHLVPLVLPDYL